MILFFDTETSGMVEFRLPVDHPSQPHIVQLAALLCHDDEECTIARQYVALVKPDGWYVEEGALAIHGISTDHCFKFGESAELVMRTFYSIVEQMIEPPDEQDALGGRICGHNITFDIRMMLREAYELPRFDAKFINKLEPFCTMRALTPHCRLPHPRHLHGFKWPTLSESYRFMFNTDLVGAHSALVDTLATRELFVEGRRRGWWK